MNTLFLSCLYPKEFEDQIRKSSKIGIDNAANNFQWALLSGLDYYFSKLVVLTQPVIGSYPLRYKKIYLNSDMFSHKEGSKGFLIGFINLPLLKLIFKTFSLAKFLNKNSLLENTNLIIIYSIHTPFLFVASMIKKKYPNIKFCLIVPDLPEYMSESKNLFYLFFKKIDSFLIKKYLKDIDSFVLLTDSMHEMLNVEDRPWVRIEGIYNDLSINQQYDKENFKTILYSGSLASRYGIDILINAFKNIRDDNFRLWICGAGEYQDELEKVIKDDKRIVFFGQIKREDVLVLQRKATVLVNPRTSEGDYTKYSFPSKIIEYLASGTPTIINRLDGIPSEYYNYTFVPHDETSEALMNEILLVCSKSQEELNDFGKRARDFILYSKTAHVQCKKIKEINSIFFAK